MGKAYFSSSDAAPRGSPVEDQDALILLRRWIVETEQAILQSRALIRQTRDSIEFLEKLQVPRYSN
jgi:hypothetical protein